MFHQYCYQGHDSGFHIDNVVYDQFSLSAIVEVLTNPNYDMIAIYFISYAQLRMGATNTTKSIMIGVISLQSSGELNGYYFMSLATVNQLHGFNWNRLTIDDYIIDSVEEIARSDNQPIMTNGYPIFE